MTIDEAIIHCEEVAEGYEEDISKWEYTLSEYRKRECVEQTTIPRCEKELNRCKQCESEHRQLAEWLRDYKRLKEQEPETVIYSGDGYADGYMVYDMAECPNCGYKYEDGDKDWGLPFCPNCGQALNWERSDKE